MLAETGNAPLSTSAKARLNVFKHRVPAALVDMAAHAAVLQALTIPPGIEARTPLCPLELPNGPPRPPPPIDIQFAGDLRPSASQRAHSEAPVCRAGCLMDSSVADGLKSLSELFHNFRRTSAHAIGYCQAMTKYMQHRINPRNSLAACSIIALFCLCQAARAQGIVSAWGFNLDAELGNGTYTTSPPYGSVAAGTVSRSPVPGRRPVRGLSLCPKGVWNWIKR